MSCGILGRPGWSSKGVGLTLRPTGEGVAWAQWSHPGHDTISVSLSHDVPLMLFPWQSPASNW